MSYVRIAKPGFNASISTDYREMRFDSEYNTLKLRTIITATGSVTNHDNTQILPNSVAYFTATLPSDVIYTPQNFAWIAYTISEPSGILYGYDAVSGGAGGGSVYVILNASGIPTIAINYYAGGSTTLSATANIYVFANPI